jgi:hypothetical protein
MQTKFNNGKKYYMLFDDDGDVIDHSITMEVVDSYIDDLTEGMDENFRCIYYIAPMMPSHVIEVTAEIKRSVKKTKYKEASK